MSQCLSVSISVSLSVCQSVSVSVCLRLCAPLCVWSCAAPPLSSSSSPPFLPSPLPPSRSPFPCHFPIPSPFREGCLSAGAEVQPLTYVLKTLDRENKSIHHHRGTPSLLVCCPTQGPRGHRAKKAMVYTISLGKQLLCIPFVWENKGEGHTPQVLEGSDPERKGGFHGGGVYFFLPCWKNKP